MATLAHEEAFFNGVHFRNRLDTDLMWWWMTSTKSFRLVYRSCVLGPCTRSCQKKCLDVCVLANTEARENFVGSRVLHECVFLFHCSGGKHECRYSRTKHGLLNKVSRGLSSTKVIENDILQIIPWSVEYGKNLYTSFPALFFCLGTDKIIK